MTERRLRSKLRKRAVNLTHLVAPLPKKLQTVELEDLHREKERANAERTEISPNSKRTKINKRGCSKTLHLKKT